MSPPQRNNSDFDFSDDAPLQSFNKVGVPVWVVCSLAVFFVTVTASITLWVANKLNDIDRKLDAAAGDRWKMSYQREYNWELERLNKGTIQVPNPDEIVNKVR